MPSYPTYESTRGGYRGLSFDEAVFAGLALDGGLFVPSFIPKFTPEEIEAFLSPAKPGPSFQELAFAVISKFIPVDVVADADLRSIIATSYGTFRDPAVTPVKRTKASGPIILELFHGPTFAFKDVALQFLGNLFEHLLVRRARLAAEGGG